VNDLDDFQVTVSELLIATPDRSDPLIDKSVHQVLKLLRDQHKIEAAFVGEVVDGNRIRRGSTPSAPKQFVEADADPLELAFCKQVVRSDAPDSRYLSAPIVLNDGGVYGKLYSVSANPDSSMLEQALKKLALTAQLAARLITERLPAAGSAAAR
jgi:hypothetical protein